MHEGPTSRISNHWRAISRNFLGNQPIKWPWSKLEIVIIWSLSQNSQQLPEVHMVNRNNSYYMIFAPKLTLAVLVPLVQTKIGTYFDQLQIFRYVGM